MKSIAILSLAAFLIACAVTRPPAIVDLSKADSTITVSVSPDYENTSEILSVANKGCRKFGMDAEGLPSGRCAAWHQDGWGILRCMEEHYLFACVTQ